MASSVSEIGGNTEKIHQEEIALLAFEIDRYIPTWATYVSGLLKYLGCDKVSL